MDRASSVSGVPEAWRDHVLNRMLTSAALIAPPVLALSMFAGASARTHMDLAVLLAAGLLFPAARVVPRLPKQARATIVMAICLGVSLYLFGRFGLVAGLIVSTLTGLMFGVILLGPRVGFTLIGLTTLAIVFIGLQVTRGSITLFLHDADPLQLRNWVRMAATTSLLAMLLATVVDFVIRQVEASARASTEALSELRLAYERLGGLHGRLDAAKEQERSALSHELHDELGQTLTALKLRLQMGGPAREGLAETVVLVDQLITRVRKMSGDLRPPLLNEIGLVPALRAYLEAQATLSGLVIDFTADAPVVGAVLSPDLEIICFRVVQESLTNTLRHAGAQRVVVHLRRDAVTVGLSISDDGRGFDPAALEAAAAAGHLGVIGMRERVRARRGSFRLASRPGGGTTTEVELPIGARAEDGPEDDSGGRTAPGDRAARQPEIGSWREDVRSGMLTVAAVVVPLLATLALLVGPPRALRDIVILAAAGFLFPVLRLTRVPSISTRAIAAIIVLFCVSLYLLARAGFATGISGVLATTAVMGVVCFRRSFGFVLIGVSGISYLVVGTLAHRGLLRFDPAEVDPMQLAIWVRTALLIALLAAMLAIVIDFVIRHVEAADRATTSALGELRLAYKRLGQLHGRLENAKEEERRFLAHELHDELGQTLTAIKLRLQLGARGAGYGDPRRAAADAVDDAPVLELIDQLIARVRRLSSDLRPPLLDEVGLFPALRAYLETQAAASGIAIDLEANFETTDLRLAPDVEIACFRVVQEAIANALRHASARRLAVQVSATATRVAIAIRDDGRGFDPGALDQAAAAGHIGVVGMRERVRARSGSFRLTSAPGAGTTVEVEIPAT